MFVKIKGSKYTPINNTNLVGKLDNDNLISTTWILNNDLIGDELNEFITDFTQVSKNHNLRLNQIAVSFEIHERHCHHK